MKKLILILTFLLAYLVLNAQQYNNYFQQGKEFYNNQDFFRALERFDLAYEFAKSEVQKREIKAWKLKCKTKIIEQQDNLRSALNKSEQMQKDLETILRYSVNIVDNDSTSKIQLYEYFKSIGISNFKERNYFDAINNLKMARLCPDYIFDNEIDKIIINSIDSLDKLKKIALVIGNADYLNAPLRHPTKDAYDIARKLSLLNFDVSLYLNLNRKEFRQAIFAFSEVSKIYDIVLFYYNGHGVMDYMVPLKHNVQTEGDIDDECISINFLLSSLEYSNNDSKKIVIIDACRDNPFSRDWNTISSSFKTLRYTDNTIIGYGTTPSGLTYDGDNNSLFTQELLKNIMLLNTSFQEVFRKTLMSVIKESKKKQLPVIYDNLQHNLYLNYEVDDYALNDKERKLLKSDVKTNLNNQIKNNIDRILEINAFDNAVRNQYREWKGYNNTNIKERIEILEKINLLDLKSKNLSRLPKEVIECKNLKSIDLRFNKGLDLNECFKMLSRINQLSNITISTEDLFEIDTIYWEMISGLHIPASSLMGKLKYLKRLNELTITCKNFRLKNTDILFKELSELDGLEKLEYLCYHDSLPPEVLDLKNIKSLKAFSFNINRTGYLPKNIVELDFIHTALWEEIADNFEYNKEFETAVNAYLKAIEYNPTNYRLYERLSYNYLLLNRPEKAIETAKKSLELNPETESIKYLVIAYALSNNFKKAKNIFLERKGKNFTSFSYSKPWKDVILEFIEKLEQNGVKHRNLVRYKNFLAKE